MPAKNKQMASTLLNISNGTTTGHQELGETDLACIRKLLLGPEYQVALKKLDMLDNPVFLASLITPAIQEALNNPENNLQSVLTPSVVNALMDSVSNDPKPIADTLYPVMGPAIRKSINSTMGQMMSNFNQLLEQSVSPKAWRWRFDAWRTGRSYSEVVLIKNLVFQVEQVFLIHRDTGLLLQHVLADTTIGNDPDMVSAMLTAIQDFTKDSFAVEQNSGLNSLKLDDLTVLIESGPQAVLAAVVRGAVPADIQSLLTKTIEGIHLKESRRLASYSGDSSQFEHLKPLLSECLKTQLISNEDQKSEQKISRKWVGYGACICLLLASWSTYSYYKSSLAEKEWNTAKQAFQDIPGLLVTNTTHKDGEYKISGLVDPLAVEPSHLLKDSLLENINIELAFKPYLSLEPSIVVKRIKQGFDIPDSIRLNFKNGILNLAGSSTQHWLDEFKSEIRGVSGVVSFETKQVIIVK